MYTRGVQIFLPHNLIKWLLILAYTDIDTDLDIDNCFWFRYASLYFCCAVEDQDNELITLEIIHRYVELLDKYFGSVSPINVLTDGGEQMKNSVYFQKGKRESETLLFMAFLPHRCVSWISSSTLRKPILSWMSSCWVGSPRRPPRRMC